jgi:hypothetical protein
VPALIDRVLPPMEFKRIQAADLTGWSGDEDDVEYRKLLASVDALLRRPLDAAPGPVPPISLGEPSRRSTRSGVRRFLALAGVTLLAAAAVAGYLLGRQGGAPVPAVEPAASSTSDPAQTPSGTGPPPAVSSPATPASSPAKTGRINLLATENGGEVVTASHERWVSTIDGNDDTYAWTDTGYAVFGFKDGRAATFDTFSVLIPSTNDNNLGEFELLAGDDGPNGSFTSVGTFKTQNIRIMKQPYQEFRFAPVTARYLKLRSLKASNGASGSMFAYEFRLMGVLQ